mmetsp:Transcript_32613/g.45536  ORF Transcript_32613/g.45536 Transcript_32613/m.45536 type:complete len:636 (+) Transcript_32613:130-2037(+)|eukprot:jgi/Bigna1/80088/fgenesh1_pg.67_\
MTQLLVGLLAVVTWCGDVAEAGQYTYHAMAHKSATKVVNPEVPIIQTTTEKPTVSANPTTATNPAPTPTPKEHPKAAAGVAKKELPSKHPKQTVASTHGVHHRSSQHEGGKHSHHHPVVKHVAPPKPRNTKGTKSGIELRGKKLFVDGEPFFVKGVAYSPVPLGDDPLYGAPYGDYFTDEYSAFWVRDLPLLNAMGANSVRTYAWNTTRDHSKFLDMAHSNNIKVTITYFLGSTLQTPITSKEDMERVAQNFGRQVGKYKDHPAILGWTFGNEINGGWNGFIYAIDGIYGCGWMPQPAPQGCGNFDFKNKTSPCYNATACLYKHLFQWIDRAAELAHKNLGQENYRLIMSTFADIDNLADRIDRFGHWMPNIDLWAAQIYRGKTFGEGKNDFILQVNKTSDKPLAVTEYGVDAYMDSCGICTKKHCPTPCYNSPGNETKGYGEDQKTHAIWVAALAGRLYQAYHEGAGALGGYVMAWIDEAWKTTTKFPTNICADNTKKKKNGGWKYHYPHKKFDPKTCDFKAHVECPNLNIWKPSLCGQYMPAFPDHYLNEGFFGINTVYGVENTNVNGIEPRLVYAVLQDMWLPKIAPIIGWHKAAMATLMTASIATVGVTIWSCQRHFQGRTLPPRPSSHVF